MAHFHGKLNSAKVSLDGGKTWKDITNSIVGSIWIEDDDYSLSEITPNNPLYQELLDILDNAELGYVSQ